MSDPYALHLFLIDFLIHYFVLIAVGTSIASLIFCCMCLCCCLRWRRRRYLLARRKRIRYQLLHDQDDEDDDHDSVLNSDASSPKKNKTKGQSSKKSKPQTSSRFEVEVNQSMCLDQKDRASRLVISGSDYELSDENGEQTLYDKPLLASKLKIESPSTPKSRQLRVPVQDSNGSPMLRNNGQSPTTTDNSVA